MNSTRTVVATLPLTTMSRSRAVAMLIAVAALFVIAGCSSPTPSYPVTPGPDGAVPAVEDGGDGDASVDYSGRPTNVPPMGGDAYATVRNIQFPTEDPDAPYPPPATEVPEAYPSSEDE